MSISKPTYHLWQGPTGWIGIVCRGDFLVVLFSESQEKTVRDRIGSQCPGARAGCPPVCSETVRQLEEYFSGHRQLFDLPLAMDSLPPFAARVLKTLAQVPYASTVTYGELAWLAGSPHGARAVGRVMATNPFPIIIPCHRVLGAGGRLTGYSGGEGIATKQWLLHFEARHR